MCTSSSFLIQIQAIHHLSCSFIIKTNKKEKISEMSRVYVKNLKISLKAQFWMVFKKNIGQLFGRKSKKKGSIKNNFTDKANIHLN